MKKTAMLVRWMYIQRRKFIMLLCVLLTGLPAVSYASALPTSTQPPMGSWKVMYPSSFAGSIDSAKEQCLTDAAISSTDVLTTEKCQILVDELTAKKCPIVMLPDGIVLDYLNGRSRGQSVTFFNKKKQTGRDDRALLCDLGDGLSAYWFTGVKGQSCNNVAFVLPPVPVAAQEVIIMQAPTRTYFSNPIQSNSVQVLTTGVALENCNLIDTFVGGSVVISDPSTLKSRGYTEQ